MEKRGVRRLLQLSHRGVAVAQRAGEGLRAATGVRSSRQGQQRPGARGNWSVGQPAPHCGRAEGSFCSPFPGEKPAAGQRAPAGLPECSLQPSSPPGPLQTCVDGCLWIDASTACDGARLPLQATSVQSRDTAAQEQCQHAATQGLHCKPQRAGVRKRWACACPSWPPRVHACIRTVVCRHCYSCPAHRGEAAPERTSPGRVGSNACQALHRS